MKEQLSNIRLSEAQHINPNGLTTHPFPLTLKGEGSIFMAEPGQGEGSPKKQIASNIVQAEEAGRVVSPEKVAELRGFWEKHYLQGKDWSSLSPEERITIETAIEMGIAPVAGGVGQPPEEGTGEPPNPPEDAGNGEGGPETQTGGAEDGGNGEPPETVEGAGEEETPRDLEGLADRLAQIITSGSPDAYEQVEQIMDLLNSNDRSYGALISRTMERLRPDTEHVYQIDYFLEYAMERIISRADVSPTSEYPRFSLEEDLNLGDILAYARIYDHSINVLSQGRERPEGAQGTIFKYLDDLRGRRHIMHELSRNMKDRRTYVSYITQNLRKEGLAFVEKEIAGVADSQIIYEKFLGDALAHKRGWLTSDDIRDVDRNVEGFMSANARQFNKEIKDENGKVVDTRPLRPWEIKRAAIVGKSLNAAMQRRLAYTVMGDVPTHDITTLLDSVDSEELARILAPMKLITERFFGIDTNTRKIFIEEVLRKTKELGDANGQLYGYGERDAAGNRKGLYGKRENSWAILDTGITDPKSNSWRGTKIFLMQKDYRTETLEGQTISIGDYIDRVKGEERETIEQELRRRYPRKNQREIDNIIDSPVYGDRLRDNFNNRIRHVIQNQRLFLGPLLQMGGLNTENKQMVWEKASEFLPSRIAAFFPDETVAIIQNVYGGSEEDAKATWNELKTKLFLAESRRVADDAENIKGKTWEEIEREGKLKNLSDYFDDVRIREDVRITDPRERSVIERITNLGKRKTNENPDGKAQELAKIKFPFTPFLDDVPKTDWENIEDFSYDRILVYDHSDFDAGYKEIIGLMAKPVTHPTQVIEAFVKASGTIQNPLGLKGPGGAQGVLEKYISAYLSMAREFHMAKYLGPFMEIFRKPRSKMELGNLKANIAINEDFTAQVLDGIAQQSVISDDPAEKDKNGLTQHGRMRKENEADTINRLYYWIRLLAFLLGPIAGAEIAKTLLPREAAEQVIAGF